MISNIDLAIIGGGPAGLAAAKAAYEKGIRDIVIFERDNTLGGILNQCIHNGFGLHIFNEELTGPEYAQRFIDDIEKLGIKVKLNTMVLDIDDKRNITTISSDDGLIVYKAKAVVLSMGCRERTRGSIGICGNRPSGVFTAGSAQYMVNMQGYLPGKNIVILGSGDIGLIMARRLTVEGAHVPMVLELMPYSSGLTRNKVQCLDDFDIPLKLSHTITEIHGKQRLHGVTIAKVDENLKPIEETKTYVECDTLLLSVGLIPENELSENIGVCLDRVTKGPKVTQDMQTNIDGVFACGNVVHVHDLVDYVTYESVLCGSSAAKYILNDSKASDEQSIKTITGENVRYIVPHTIDKESLSENNKLYFRVGSELMDVKINVKCGDNVLYTKRERKVAPGEMCSVPCSKIDFDKVNDDITVEVIQKEV